MKDSQPDALIVLILDKYIKAYCERGSKGRELGKKVHWD